MSASEAVVAVVTIAHGRHDHLRRQQATLGTQEPSPSSWVLVSMGDPELAEVTGSGAVVPRLVEELGPPHPLPLARARNRGAETALDAGADVVVFLDVDCLAGPGLVGAYADAVREQPDVVWSGPVTYLPPGLTEEQLRAPWEHDDPHPARPGPAPGERVLGGDPDLFWSLSFAVGRDAWRRTGGFCEEYAGYGGEDTDFGRLVVDAGLELGWVGSARAYHQHHPTQHPPVQHLDDLLRNGAVFHRRWGTWPMRGWFEAFEARGLVRRAGDAWQRC